MKKLFNLFAACLSLFLVVFLTSCQDVTKALGSLDGETYTITYETEYGAAPESGSKKSGETLTAMDLPDLVADGYVFKGWYLKGTNTKLNVGDSVSKNITLVAKWEKTGIVPSDDFNKQSTSGDSFIIEKPLFICEQNPNKKLTTNEIAYNRDAGENGYGIIIENLGDYQVLELTYKGGNLKTDEENVIAVMFDKYLTYNHRMGGDRHPVTADSQTISIDIPQGIGLNVFIIQQKYNTNNADWGDTNLNLPKGWEKDFSFFVEKIELKKDPSKIPYTITQTADSYIIEKPQLQNVWHANVDGNKASFKSEEGLAADGKDFTAVYWEFEELADYNKAVITVSGKTQGYLSFAGYSPYNYNSTSMAEKDMHDYHSGWTNTEWLEEWTDENGTGKTYYVSKFALDLDKLKPNDNGTLKPFKALEITNAYYTEEVQGSGNWKLKDWDIEVEKIELYKIDKNASDLVIFDPTKKDTYTVKNKDVDIAADDLQIVIGPDGNKYLKITPNKFNLSIDLSNDVNIEKYQYVKALVYADDNTPGNWIGVLLRDFHSFNNVEGPVPYGLNRASHDLSNNAETYPILYSALIKGTLATSITGFVQDKNNGYAEYDNKTIYIGKIIATNNNTEGYNPFIKDLNDKSENPIKLDVKVPANMLKVEIQRREVKESGNPLSDFEEIGAQWIQYNDNANWTKNQNKKFTDRYTVKNGHYYEYRAISYNEDWDIAYTQNLGIHLAGYNGFPKPELPATNYPEIKWELKDDGLYFKILNENVLTTMDYKKGGTPLWITHNLEYKHYYGYETLTPWLGCRDDQKMVRYMSIEDYKALPTGIYNLNSFAVDAQFDGDYFDARFFYDVKSLDKSKIADSVAHEPEEMENGGFKMTVQLPVGYENVNVINDITIQCREKPLDPAKQYDWPIHINEYQTRKGFLTKDFFEGRVYNNNLIDFYDYFGFEAGKRYQYRAIVRINDDYESLDIALGEVDATKDSLPKPAFKGDVKPAFSWNADTETLSVTNEPELVPSNELLKEWDCGDKWEWGVALGYAQQGADEGYWPYFVLKAANETWSETSMSYPVENWHKFKGKNYTLNADEYYVGLFIPGQGISQYIAFDLSDLGEADKLTR